MEQTPRRTTIRGPTFIRLLAGLADLDVPQPRQALSDRLSQWLDWTHAVALSTALDGRLSAPEPAEAVAADDEAHECARVRASLAQAIARDRAFAELEPATAAAAADEAFFRQRYYAMQRSMATGIGHLRARLRGKLARGTPDLARLAAVDAAMEGALALREHRLLAAVPSLLGLHFERLRQAAQEAPADEPAPEAVPASTPAAWLAVFRRDMQGVLLAELDVRFQPVEGLLAALRTRPLGRYVQTSA